MRIKFSLLTLVLAGVSTLLSAQGSNVFETERMMSFGSRPCFRLEFTNADDGLVEDVWKDFVKKTFDTKLKKNKKANELYAPELHSAMLGSEQFTLYSVIEKSGKNASINVWFDLGSKFLSRRDDPSKAAEIARSLQQFYYDVRRAVVGNEVKEQEDKKKELDSKLKKLQKDSDGLRKDIENYKARIKKAEDDLLKNEKDQESTIVDIEAQRRMVEEVRARLNNVENEKQ